MVILYVRDVIKACEQSNTEIFRWSSSFPRGHSPLVGTVMCRLTGSWFSSDVPTQGYIFIKFPLLRRQQLD